MIRFPVRGLPAAFVIGALIAPWMLMAFRFMCAKGESLNFVSLGTLTV